MNDFCPQSNCELFWRCCNILSRSSQAMIGVSKVVQPCRTRLHYASVRWATGTSTSDIPDCFPVAPSQIALQDPDRINLQKRKKPEERLEDLKTHTGQKWDSDDYRLVRFTNFPKLVNQRRAIDLINEVAPCPVKGSVTYCDGGHGAMGHPKVYINVDKPGNHACGYCGLRFYKDEHGH